jgi:GT2 family glycosyltransferase
LLNPDVFLQPGDLRRLVEAARLHDGDIVAPGFLWPDGTVQEFGFRLLADGSTRAVEQPTDDGYDYCSAACWVLPKALFDELDGFDRAFHPAYYEDVDFVLRAKQQGRSIRLIDDVQVVHAVHSGTASGWTEAIPDVSRQRAVFAERWADLLADRPAE